MNLLFVCSSNRLRSPTAKAVFSDIEGHSILSAGIRPDANTPVSAALIDWADTVFVMERWHLTTLELQFSSLLRSKRVVVLDISDQYSYMDPNLVLALKKKVTPHLLPPREP
jgi:predicted protein tyrosine phosphatase